MPSHSVAALLGEEPLAGERVRATVRLACGCVVTREVRGDRLLERAGGERFVVGKEPCPAGHAVGDGGTCSREE